MNAQISATMGYEVKHTRSTELQNEVDAWLANGNKIRAPDAKQEETEQEINGQLKIRNDRLVADAAARREIQIPIMAEYVSWANPRNRWKVLADKIELLVSASTLNNVYKGTTTILDIKVWRKIVEAIEELRHERCNPLATTTR